MRSAPPSSSGRPGRCPILPVSCGVVFVEGTLLGVRKNKQSKTKGAQPTHNNIGQPSKRAHLGMAQGSGPKACGFILVFNQSVKISPDPANRGRKSRSLKNSKNSKINTQQLNLENSESGKTHAKLRTHSAKSA